MHGPATDEPLVWYEGTGTSDKRYFAADERGSIVAVNRPSTSTTTINTYDDYGAPGSSNTGRFQYTGQTWTPEVGLYNYKARFYSPTLGRFITPDPIGYGDGMNMYAYVGGDPINATDPTGMYEVCANEYWGDYVPGVDTNGSAPGGESWDYDNATPIYVRRCRSYPDGPGPGAGSRPAPTQPWLAPGQQCLYCLVMPPTKCVPQIVALGNWLANASDKTASGSAGMIGSGIVVGLAGGVAGVPQPGLLIMAAGGALGELAGGLQIASGVVHGIGGASPTNAYSGIVTLGTGAVLSRVVRGPAPKGSRSRSQRSEDKFMANAAISTGGVYDLVQGLIAGLGPKQQKCP